MKKSNSILVLAVLITTGYMQSVAAHVFSGAVAAGKVDIVNFNCFADTDLSTAADGTTSSLDAQQVFIDLVAGNVMAAVGHINMISPANQNWSGQAVDSSTSVGGAILTPPALKTAGIWSSHGYTLSVSNGTTTTQNYTVNYHCQRIGGAHTGTGVFITSGTTDPSADYAVTVNQ